MNYFAGPNTQSHYQGTRKFSSYCHPVSMELDVTGRT